MKVEIDGHLEGMKSALEILRERNLQTGGLVQRTIDSEVLRLCDPYVPKDSGDLIRSGIIFTQLGSGKVVYQTPYARRWYYRPANFQGAPKRGNYWFERMKKEGGRNKILQAAAAVSGGRAKG